MKNLEKHFFHFRNQIIGINKTFQSPSGEEKKIIYADWIASGRLYKTIEDKITYEIGPFVANTHSGTGISSSIMTNLYREAQKIIKSHCNAGSDDIIITGGSGMTSMINKFQRLLGLAVPEQVKKYINIPEIIKPVVFLTHMEHHSNHTSWLESAADVIVIPPDKKGLTDLRKFANLLEENKNRSLILGSFTACSNVTGIKTPYYEMAEMIHNYKGFCFVDFAASAPYVKIDMHPENKLQQLDAVFFSPHKFLGGPGTSGVLIFNKNLYNRNVPDQPGGGTVDWTDPWGHYKFVDDIETREDGGTPGFLQTIKTALCIKLKEKMNISFIKKRENELLDILFDKFSKIKNLHILASEHNNRLAVISFYTENVHYNFVARALNDEFGIQVRGGCSCAGTYGHYLLHLDPTRSKRITDKINNGDLSEKPGWVRVSLHPTMTNDEVLFIADAIDYIIKNAENLSSKYEYSSRTNEFYPKESINRPFIYEDFFRLE
ncbi:MAG: aminotransferase class V-fold PLP-dependent enzyme [Ignavibacteria bacterium]|nr:aminotransferase class V-fold PLP-dependent enzyme [Ignavibacteria bacterium]